MANNRLETHAELKWRQAPMGLFKLDEYFAFKYSRKKKWRPTAMGLYQQQWGYTKPSIGLFKV